MNTAEWRGRWHHYLMFTGVVLLCACQSTPKGPAAWKHLSSVTGELEAPGVSTQQTAALIVDVDGDGDDDFIIGARRAAPALVLYRYTGSGWERFVIENEELQIEAGGDHFDIDGDGDEDIVFGGDSRSTLVWWWENPSPDFQQGVNWVRRVVTETAGKQHHDQIFGDFDHDGQAELAFWVNQSRELYVAEIPSQVKSADSWPTAMVYQSDEKPEGFASADINADGKLDLIGRGCWFEHTGGTNYAVHVIDPDQNYARAAAAQLIPGGWCEVVLTPGDLIGRLKWYEWNGAAWVGHDLLDVDIVHGHSLQVADINRDGHIDIFSAEMHTPGAGDQCKLRILYGDSKGTFTEDIVSVGLPNHESRLGDLDGDGDLDILSKPYTFSAPRIDLWLQE